MTDEEKKDEPTEENPEERRIKVTDRRLFDRDGKLRPGAAASHEGEATEEEPAAETKEPAPAREPSDEEDGAADRSPIDVVSPREPSLADLPCDFSSFVEGLYLEAMLYLGALPDPRTGEVIEDLEVARYKIDILEMVLKKTEGNLTPDEKKQLDETLYQLRTLFVQKKKASTL